TLTDATGEVIRAGLVQLAASAAPELARGQVGVAAEAVSAVADGRLIRDVDLAGLTRLAAGAARPGQGRREDAGVVGRALPGPRAGAAGLDRAAGSVGAVGPARPAVHPRLALVAVAGFPVVHPIEAHGGHPIGAGTAARAGKALGAVHAALAVGGAGQAAGHTDGGRPHLAEGLVGVLAVLVDAAVATGGQLPLQHLGAGGVVSIGRQGVAGLAADGLQAGVGRRVIEGDQAEPQRQVDVRVVGDHGSRRGRVGVEALGQPLHEEAVPIGAEAGVALLGRAAHLAIARSIAARRRAGLATDRDVGDHAAVVGDRSVIRGGHVGTAVRAGHHGGLLDLAGAAPA